MVLEEAAVGANREVVQRMNAFEASQFRRHGLTEFTECNSSTDKPYQAGREIQSSVSRAMETDVTGG